MMKTKKQLEAAKKEFLATENAAIDAIVRDLRSKRDAEVMKQFILPVQDIKHNLVSAIKQNPPLTAQQLSVTIDGAMTESEISSFLRIHGKSYGVTTVKIENEEVWQNVATGEVKTNKVKTTVYR